MNSTSLVFFCDGASSLQRAEQELRRYKFNVRSYGDSLVVAGPGSQDFRITLAQQPHVLKEAQEIGRGTEYEQALSRCDARFEIDIPDLDEALAEINTLIEVQGALQDASAGYLFLPWNCKITEPWIPEGAVNGKRKTLKTTLAHLINRCWRRWSRLLSEHRYLSISA